MVTRNTLEIPKSLARLRWAATIRAGIDPEEFIPDALREASGVALSANALGGLNSLLTGLLPVGTVETATLTQVHKNKKRYRLGPNSIVPFQTVPQQVDYALRLGRVTMKRLPQVEAVFNFLPSNLVFQQLPFVIELRDVGDQTADTLIRHFLMGCWFADSVVKWDVTSARENAKSIQEAVVDVTNVITFDNSNAGNPTVSFATSLTSFLARNFLPEEAEDLISDLNIA